MSNIKELPKPEIGDLQRSLCEVIENYVESEDRAGRQVTYAHIVGTLEFVKDFYINFSGARE